MIAILIALALFPSPQVPEQASLRVVDRQPLVVRGTGFAPRERVVLLAAARRHGDKRVLANASGVFVARFDFGVPRCAQLWIRAIGARGTQARYRLRPVLDCMPDD